MKKTSRTALSLLFAALAFVATVAGVAALDADNPVQVAQSTSAILEDRAA